MQIRREQEWLLWTIDAEFAEKTIMDFLQLLCIARKDRYFMQQEKALLLNQKIVTYTTILHTQDVLSIHAFTPTEIDFTAQDIFLDVLYEDDILLAVNKPPFQLVHPDQKDGLDTLCNAVAHYYKKQEIQCAVRPIHRLDYETSGIVLFSKCGLLQPLLDKMLANKEIQRSYTAIVLGVLKLGYTKTIQAPIGKDRHSANRRRISNTGQPAITHIRCTKSVQIDRYSVLTCTLETGRTHQIRVHLAHIGYPILSDALYGKPSRHIARLALHAHALTLVHPLTRKCLQIDCPLPSDMKITRK